MGQPAAPAGRHVREVGLSGIDHPAPLGAHGRVDHVALRAVIFVAELVLTDEATVTPCVELRAVGRAVPPGQDSNQVLFKGHASVRGLEPGLWWPPALKSSAGGSCR